MGKIFFLLVVILIMSFGLLSGCKKTIKIADFDGMCDLSRNPNKIVFGTNSNTFNEETGWGLPIEYEVHSDKIAEITEKLFAIKYEALPKGIEIDISPISRYLILYDHNGNTWNVNLGLRRHNDRWYSPVNDDDLIKLLYEAISFEDYKVTNFEEKIIWNGTIEDIVDNETIIITIDQYFNSKQFKPDDFKMVEIVEESFEWLTKSAYDNYIETNSLPKDFRHIIILKIVDKGKQNLIDAIRQLEAVNFVNSASPNSYDSPD